MYRLHEETTFDQTGITVHTIHTYILYIYAPRTRRRTVTDLIVHSGPLKWVPVVAPGGRRLLLVHAICVAVAVTGPVTDSLAVSGVIIRVVLVLMWMLISSHRVVAPCRSWSPWAPWPPWPGTDITLYPHNSGPVNSLLVHQPGARALRLQTSRH